LLLLLLNYCTSPSASSSASTARWRPGHIHHRDPSHHCVLDYLHSFQFFRCQLDHLSSVPGVTKFRCS
jgi:hypothetical protein